MFLRVIYIFFAFYQIFHEKDIIASIMLTYSRHLFEHRSHLDILSGRCLEINNLIIRRDYFSLFISFLFILQTTLVCDQYNQTAVRHILLALIDASLYFHILIAGYIIVNKYSIRLPVVESVHWPVSLACSEILNSSFV